MKIQAYGFDRTGTLPVIALHEFEMHDGQFVHSIDGTLRATVPPEGLDAYVAAYPACAPIAQAIKAAPVAVQAVFIGEEGREKAARVAEEAARVAEEQARA